MIKSFSSEKKEHKIFNDYYIEYNKVTLKEQFRWAVNMGFSGII